MNDRILHLPVSNDGCEAKEIPEVAINEVVGHPPSKSILERAILFFKRFSPSATIQTTLSVRVDERLRHIDSIGPRAESTCGVYPISEVVARNYPYRMICLLVIKDAFGGEFAGTGFFISPRCVITAGHCVFSGGKFVQEIEVIPGVKGNESPPFGAQISRKFDTTKGWVNLKSEKHDYGVVFLPDNELHRRIGRCHFGYKIIEDNAKDLELTVSGYPENKAWEQWQGAGPILGIEPDKLTYRVDTERGNSGSPVFVSVNDIYYALGVHNYGLCPNFCTRVTREVMDNFVYWINVSNKVHIA